MAKVIVALSMSLDGYIAGPNDGPDNPLGNGGMRLFDELIEPGGAVVTGRRTYEITHGWGGHGPVPGLPLFIVTHPQEVPQEVPHGESQYAFVTDGGESAIGQARATAGDKYVSLMGGAVPQQALRLGLVDEIQIHLAPVLLGGGVSLFERVPHTCLEPIRVVEAPGVTHLRFRVLA